MKIDLHTHTSASDGNQSPLRIISKAYHLGIDILSITDHNSCNGYIILQKQISNCKKETSKSKLRKILSNVHIIKGIELTTSYKGYIIDILGYNFDIKKMQRNAHKFHKSLPTTKDILINGLSNIITKNRLVFDKSVLNTSPIYIAFFNELKSHKENEHIFHNIYTPKQLLIQHLNNPNSPLYIDITMCFPSIHDTIACIQKSSGLAFIAHIGRYSTRIKYELDNIISCGINGIEVWYPLHNTQLESYLLNKVNKYNLLASGGSDNHYSFKKDDYSGLGNITIPNIPSTQWIKNTIDTGNNYIIHNI